ncbi:MAG: hypothetical protein COV38_11100 [Bdellovibrionales bacterium CG11_big_fil_rev_8_21_14_0_20_38_13]|nr:MAG: hypothetical protein COW79_11485 [Bdellovibrionales bacterium CG22_combo_CG10-13_8_21_14_all_38_13]PIR29285.1 MAG: hypothetical protein COV38_11100 [Bdellovibrionales bacterium CG11_big_fil_rev_8_21_14_0_20_38_13]
MKFLKTLTTFSLIFALFTLHIEGRAIAFATSYSAEPRDDVVVRDRDTVDGGEYVEAIATPNATDAVGNSSNNTLDYRASRQEAGKLTMNQIMVLLILLIGPTVAISCFNTISGKLFSAGVAIYLIMEIMNYSSYKKAVQSTREMYAELTDDAAVNTEQIDALVAAESMERTAADAVKKRAGNTKILTIAITAAAIASFAESIWGTATFVTCSVGSVGTGLCGCEEADKVLQSCLGVPCSKVKTCTAVAGGLAAVCSHGDVNKKNQPFNSLDVYGPKLYAESNDQSEDLNFIENYISQKKSTTNAAENLDLSFLPNLIDSFLSSAHAGDSGPAAKGLLGFGIAGAALGAALAYYTTTYFSFLDKLGVGWIRGIFFTVLAGFGLAAYMELNNAAKKLNQNADIYKSLYERLLAAMNSSSRFANMDGINNGVRDRIRGYQGVRDEMNNPPNGALCLVGNLGEQTVDANCSCRQNNTCSKVDFSAVDFGGQGLPGFFGQTTSGLQTGANSLFSGNLSGANGAFAGMGNNAANLRKLNDRIKGKAISQLDSLNKGKSKTNLEKVEKDLNSALEKVAPQIIKSAQQKNGSNLASLGIGTSGLSSGFGGKPEDLKPKDVLASINQAAAPAPSSGGAADPLAGFKFDFPKDGASDNLDATGADGALSQGDALGEFENNESDINDRKSESIFKIITFRYFKSAYPRFFDEDKKEEEKPTLE